MSYASGPESRPPSDALVYSWPSDRAAASVHCIAGESKLRLFVRLMKFEPGRVRTLSCAPLKPPRETSYGEVTSDVDTEASRGRLEPPNAMPLSVALF